MADKLPSLERAVGSCASTMEGFSRTALWSPEPSQELPALAGDCRSPPALGSRCLPAGTRMTVEQAQRLAERSLAQLAPIAGTLCCVLAQPELSSAALSKIGFASLLTAQQLAEAEQAKGIIEGASALLIVSLGEDVGDAEQAIAAVSASVADAPTQLVVMLMPFLGCASTFLAPGAAGIPSTAMHLALSDPQASARLGEGLAEARARLFDAGADDAIGLFAGEALKPHRVLESLHRSEYVSRQVGEIVDAQAASAETHAAGDRQAAHEEVLMQLPGRVLENIPSLDATAEERYDADFGLKGIGAYEFARKLGTGSYATVHKAEHYGLGTCAVKVISKRDKLKSVSQLVCLERELCLLLYLEAHPNIVRAHEVIHSESAVYCVMEYAGQQNLDRYVRAAVGRTGAAALAPEVYMPLCEQQAAALSHLHGSMVCHRDLKPENWIVSDCGETVRLADFGLAVQVCSPRQPLKQCCGTLPYCAPEVYRKGGRRRAHPGYSGLAADVWSLGLGFMELTLGHRSVDRMLGWCPKAPADPVQVSKGLERLAVLREQATHEEEPSGLGRAIDSMVVLDPAKRWSIGHVLGTQGLAVVPQLRAPRAGMRARTLRPRARSAMGDAEPCSSEASASLAACS